jgi:hypothetical protein
LVQEINAGHNILSNSCWNLCLAEADCGQM